MNNDKPAQYTRQIEYSREDKDFAVSVNGHFIGFAKTFLEAEQKADEYVHRAIREEVATIRAAFV